MTYPYAGQFARATFLYKETSPLPPATHVETDQLMASRSISFTSPVLEYPSRHEQYYSNPKVPISPGGAAGLNSKVEYASMPIDLTKPRQEDAMQMYLAERAMRDSKMKQNQVYRSSQMPNTSVTLSTMTMSTAGVGLLSTTLPMSYTSGSQANPRMSSNIGLLTMTTSISVASTYQKSISRNISSTAFTSTSSTAPIVSSYQKPALQVPQIDVQLKRRQSPVPEFPANSFDALKNSPNPSKVTYTKSWTPTPPKTESSQLPETAAAAVPSESSKVPTNVILLTEKPIVYSVSQTSIVDPPSTSAEASKELSVILSPEIEKSEPLPAAGITSGMDTLAEIAASSVKLDTSIPKQNEEPSTVVSKSSVTQTVASTCSTATTTMTTTIGAKSVASEYLKFTSKAHQFNSKSDREDTEDSGESDDESNWPNKPPTDFVGGHARTVVVGEDGFKNTNTTGIVSGVADIAAAISRGYIQEDGRSVCTICSKTFPKKHQMILHMNIHYMERKFRCEPCAVSFRTQGHLQKHERSEAHKNKVLMTSTFGVPTTTNPRPFECVDCKIAFRIHGHLAKHLRSKTHVQKLECLQKLPFGTYAEIERAGISLTDIDTTDCDNSLSSLKVLAQKLLDKDPSKLSAWSSADGAGGGSINNNHNNNYSTSESRESNSDDGGEPICSADDEASNGPTSATGPVTGAANNDISSGGMSVSIADSTFSSVSIPVKRKIDAISGGVAATVGIAYNDSEATVSSASGSESQEKRLKIVTDTTLCQI